MKWVKNMSALEAYRRSLLTLMLLFWLHKLSNWVFDMLKFAEPPLHLCLLYVTVAFLLPCDSSTRSSSASRLTPLQQREQSAHLSPFGHSCSHTHISKFFVSEFMGPAKMTLNTTGFTATTSCDVVLNAALSCFITNGGGDHGTRCRDWIFVAAVNQSV